MKKSIDEDEIPLTHSSPIIQQTRATFESLFLAAVKQEKEKKKVKETVTKRKKHKRSRRNSEELLPSAVDNLSNTSFSGNDEIKGKLSDNEQSPFRNNVPLASRRTNIGNSEEYRSKNHIDNTTLITKNTEIETASQSSSFASDDNLLNVKRPIPLPRKKVNIPKVTENIDLYKSSGDDSDCGAKSLVVRALVSASHDSPLFSQKQSPEHHALEKSFLNHDDNTKLIQKCSDSDGNKEIELKNLKHYNENIEEIIPCSSVGKDDSDVKVNTKVQKQKFKNKPSKKKKVISSPQNVKEITDLEASKLTASTSNYNKIIGIFIHRADYLQVDEFVQHPLVKVHLIDSDTGEYIRKTDRERAVVSYYEDDRVDYILPVMTGYFDFKERRSILPCWEELLVFNEDVTFLYRTDISIIIMFEILDFVNAFVAKSRLKKMGPEGGWHKIAWAFLKPVGKNGLHNTEKMVRLQLYKPQNIKAVPFDVCEPYFWWRGGTMERYPSSLYVTVKGIVPPDHLHPALRSQNVLQGESSSCIINMEGVIDQQDVARASSQTSLAPLQVTEPVRNWSRLPSQSCKIPNHKLLALPTTSRGCFSVKFSHSGIFLACAMVGQQNYPIVIYTIPDGKEYVKFIGHQGVVYDLCWSDTDSLLLSASADCTVCLWDLKQIRSQCLQMLPHPSFVYCAQFCPENNSLLVTGCYDHVLRIWKRSSRSKQYELFQELEGHSGYVNSMCFDKYGGLITGDSDGNILVWSRSSKKSKSDWKLHKNIIGMELKGVVINKILCHPGGQRGIIHTRDSLLRMIELNSGCVIQWFRGSFNHRVQTSSCVSPCGGLLFAASEDGSVIVWDVDTGEQLAQYMDLGFKSGATGMDYHPHEHLVAFSSYGHAYFILVFNYQVSVNDKDINLHLPPQQKENNNPVLSRSHMDTDSLNTSNKNKLDSRAVRQKSNNTANVILEKEQDNIVSSPSVTSRSLTSKDNPSEFPPLTKKNVSDELKLSAILEKMDQVLSFASSKPSTQYSDSSKSENITKVYN